MTSVSVESFISFCDDMIIAEEKLETNILDKTLAKTMILYHGSPKELTSISPNSVNMGTRLSKKRKSSFWTKNLDYAVVWALDWVAMRFNMPYFHNIEGKCFVVPDWTWTQKDSSKSLSSVELLLYSLKEHPVYVYKAVIPVKYIGRGQLPIDEYTVDKEITNLEKIVVTPQLAKKYIKMVPTDQFEKEIDNKRGLIKKEKTTLLEKAIFHKPNKILQKRMEEYK